MSKIDLLAIDIEVFKAEAELKRLQAKRMFASVYDGDPALFEGLCNLFHGMNLAIPKLLPAGTPCH